MTGARRVYRNISRAFDLPPEQRAVVLDAMSRLRVDAASGLPQLGGDPAAAAVPPPPEGSVGQG